MYNDIILKKDFFIKVIEDLATMVEKERDYFTELDSKIGDGDHGINMSIGFREVTSQLPSWQEMNLTDLFKKVGMTILGKVGGSSGPLYGSFFIKFGVPANKENSVNFIQFYEMFKIGIEAIENRGKAVVGDKTMVDALRPGLDAFSKAVEENLDCKVAFGKFVDVAKSGADSCIPIIALKGRAMRLGERAIGHLDPGAASATYILDVFYKNLQEYIK